MEDNGRLVLKSPLKIQQAADGPVSALEKLLSPLNDSCTDISIHGSFVKSLDASAQAFLWEKCGASLLIKRLQLTRFLTGSFPLPISTLVQLLQSPMGRQLESLDLTAVDVTDDVFTTVVDAEVRNEEEDIRGGYGEILQSIGNLARLKQLCLDDIFLEPVSHSQNPQRYGIDSILQSVANGSTANHLEELKIVQVFHRGGNVSPETMATFCSGTNRIQLKKLQLSGVRLPTDIVTAMAQSLHSNIIANQHEQQQAQQPTLEHLHLDSALISRESFRVIANMLQRNTSIRTLELLRLRRDEFVGQPFNHDQGMDDDIVTQFSIALRHNTTLVDLQASPLGAVTTVGFQQVALSLEYYNHTLEQIVVVGSCGAITGTGRDDSIGHCLFRIKLLLQLNKFGLRQAETMSHGNFGRALISHCSQISLDCLYFLFLTNPTLVARFLP